MSKKSLLRSVLYIIWGVGLVWGVVYANNLIYPVISSQNPHVPSFINDIFSDAVLLFVAFMPVIWAPKFFGYQLGAISKHWKMLIGMTVFFVGAPLLYRLIVGETPFGANTWFFEGVVVPLAEEGFFRGILLSMLLWGFGQMYRESTANWLTILFSTLIFSTAHLNNLGSYPTGFILFQVGFSTIVGLAFGYTRVKTESIYPAIILHALFNLAGTV
jgi:membrane protease YdiL (CAAX protease family)